MMDEYVNRLTSEALSEGLSGPYSVFLISDSGTQEIIESDLPEEVARQMVEDYAAEGVTVWMERTAPQPE